jgi:hypothetical protein
MQPEAPPSVEPQERGWVRVAAIIALLAAVTVCFYPVVTFFFSQDDFMLIHWATKEFGEHLRSSFGPVPYHFRPLTKYVYFAGAYRVFGFSPLPFHLVSLVLHLCNTLLVYLLLRRLRVNLGPALTSAGLFGLSVAFFHAIAWISCIQQLAGTFFFLLAILLAARSLGDGSWKTRWLSVLVYVLALTSIEQTLFAPVLVFMIAVFGLAVPPRPSIRRVAVTLWPHVVLLGAYGAMRLWKGIPTTGISRYKFGDNILENAAVYLGGMYDYWADMGALITRTPFALDVSHVVIAVLIVYNMIRRRLWHVLFVLSFLGLTLFPTLFLRKHYFYYHTYVAAFATTYLAAMTLQDVFRLLRLRTETRQLIASTMVIVVIAVLSSMKVRETIVRATIDGDRHTTSFVIRRARMAERLCSDLEAKAGDLTGVEKIHLLYGNPSIHSSGATYGDIVWALGQGTALNVLFDADFEVSMKYMRTNPLPTPTTEMRMFFYDRTATLYTYDEVMGEPRSLE